MKKNDGGLVWSKGPADHQKGSMYRLLRIKGNRPISFTCLSHEHWGTDTHYYGGRTTPHLPAGCKPCEAGRLAEWHGWVIGLVDGTDERAVIEFTAAAADTFNLAFSKFRTLRGVRFKLSRPNGRDNGRMHASISDTQVDSKILPKIPDVLPIMMSIWQLKLDLLPAPPAPRFLPGQLDLLNASTNGSKVEGDSFDVGEVLD